MLEGIWFPGGRRGEGLVLRQEEPERMEVPFRCAAQPGSLSVNKPLYLEVFHAMLQSTRTK